jgi:hypothetical protein
MLDLYPPRSPSLSPTRAREVLMIAGAGGAMRATEWRATAIGGKQGDKHKNAGVFQPHILSSVPRKTRMVRQGRVGL